MKEELRQIEEKMEGAIRALQHELTRLRTGRASLSLLDGVMVEYYGAPTPIAQVASLSVPDPSTIMIAPWEPKVLGDIERAIHKANIGLTPNNDGKVIRLHIPQLTEDRRKEIVKKAHEIAETSRNGIRQVRREGNEIFKKKEKSKEISEDQMHDGMDKVQKLTDTAIEKIADIIRAKEKEVMEF